MTSGVQTVIKNPSWWRRRTALEKTLTLISIVGVIAIIALAISLISVILNNKSREENKLLTKSTAQALDGSPGSHINTVDSRKSSCNQNVNDVCLTTGCIHAAANAIEAIDFQVEPCDDFYNFACGNFIKNTIIPDEKVSINTFSIIGDKLQEQLRTLISEEARPGEAKPFTLAKDLFKACMNKSLIEERGVKPLITILDKLGGWPVIKGDRWDDRSAWTWIEAVKDFRKVGYSMDYIFDFSVGIDLKNSTSRTIDIDQAAIGLSREYLIKGLEDKIVKAYYEYQVDMAVIYGAERSRAERELMESLEFEIALANISLPNEKRRNATALYNPMPLHEVQKKYNYLPWVEYINALLPPGLSVNENEIIVVSVPQYFEDLGKLLHKTPKRTIANYMMWRVTAFSSFFLTEELRKRQLVYSTALSGKQEQEPRWKECIDITSGSLPISVGALYVRKHFQQNAKRTALEMVNGIRAEFERILTTVPWMDATTRAAALTKAKAMTTHIGYPDEIMDDKKLEEYYEGLEINPDTYLESVLRMNVFGTDYAFNKLRKPVNKTDWVTHSRPAIVNAFYSSIENSIQFPAGILQGQFFSADRPRYMNYGAIGFVIGHEITHGFDDQGRQFDSDGNLVDWWEEETKTAYLSRASCIIDQYGNYTEPTTGLNLNGINTQGENIADNGGIKESYIAYKRWVEKNGPEPRLPGLDFSPQQLFWISAAQTWCSVYRTESMKMRITTGVHSPAQFRVLGPLSNMRDFASDFNCPEGSMMNPVKKCEVW
ncbi:neprilysin-2 isoform X2 [Bradysia coprophila]|uniref:neprilysin-2 isoform X2 n=1 Tax=Bradysia coprophila TaxID=38358 RepID=UPI00187DD8F6|nr:neprilysin-2 isoform X2 [Bradysia coprophila]XP_037040795.1 neprilysin-2 isoform X2 [Bradysia coprophila]XP_037040796.1 neprilysin-2 isoform X2 [Bradysia coprophila]XP_037040797.1 neprilysin-2 isoform X2 [Bradysia coprophila]XP_037040798.1 neprilysin-2 isoform X2 [Bradysia coprophila]